MITTLAAICGFLGGLITGFILGCACSDAGYKKDYTLIPKMPEYKIEKSCPETSTGSNPK